MIRATLKRGPSTDQGTFGVLTFGNDVVHSLELPWRDNMRQKSCIPVGQYVCALVKSPRFGNVYGIQNVPGRTHVLIHSANLAGDVDKGWTTQLHGCISLHMRSGVMRNKAGVMQQAGLVSKPAVSRLMEWADGQPFELEIT